MSKDIWHTKDEIPSQESRVFWKSGNIVYGGRFDTHYKCFCGPASQFVDLRKVSRWAYIDDFLALEQELIRTRKALDVAVDMLKYANKCIKGGCVNYETEIDRALNKITTLEQKESAFVHNKIEFPEFNDNLLEEFDKQFFENGQDDDLTETALEQKD